MLDIYYTVCREYWHSKSSGTTLQYFGDDPVSVEPFYQYIPDEIPEAIAHAYTICYRGYRNNTGCYFCRGGTTGLYCLVATSAFMSLMFPTIYGIALKGLGDDSTLGAAGLVMAIVGGALMPPLQGAIIDLGGSVAGLPAVNISFTLPLVCFFYDSGVRIEDK